jgi:predicted ATPase
MKQNVERIVLTGGPSSGKTTIINHLESKGFKIIRESARETLEKFGTPKNKEEIQKLELLMFGTQKERERNCSGRTFLDRSQIDYLAYTKYFLGYLPSDMSPPNYRYDKVFVLERLPFVADGTRTEANEEEAQHRHELVLNEYINQGYSPILVPTFPFEDIEGSVKRRAEFILTHL